ICGSADGTAAARFCAPAGIVNDGAGSLYVTDWANANVRRINISTGLVGTLAGTAQQIGSADGIGPNARFYYPHGITSDGAGNLYVVDSNNSTIRKVVIATGVASPLAGSAGQNGYADGTGSAARFSGPNGITSDGAGNLYVTDSSNGAIRKVVIATGV